MEQRALLSGYPLLSCNEPIIFRKAAIYMLKYDLGTGNKENWLIAETDFDVEHQGKCEAIFCQGNGYLGQRAALEEEYVRQTRDLLVTGTFNRFDEQEVCELPNLPDLTRIQLTLNGERFSMDHGTVTDYLRVLDLENGEVTRTLSWTSPKGFRYAFRFERFVSLAQEHLSGIRVCITPVDTDCTLVVESGINGQVTCTGSQHFHEGEKRFLNGRILSMVSRTIQSDVTCCLHTAFVFSTQTGSVQPEQQIPVIDRRYLGIRATLHISAGQTLIIDKLSSVTTSRDLAYEGQTEAALCAQQDGLSMLESALETGYEGLRDASRQAWAAFWQASDIRITSSHPFDQLQIRFALYHLNIMAKKDDPRVGIGAKGMTGEGYKGHSFWDTEIFILPYFILTWPDAAKSLLTYRYKGLYGARIKAKENGYEGAMYPWESAWIDDGEVTPKLGGADIITGKPIPILTGMIEQHITADIAFAVDLYSRITGDQEFMDRYGYEILIDTARFWASRVTWDTNRNAYVILDVIGPDEYKEHVNNNAYTNYMAYHNLELALNAIETLKERQDDVCAHMDEMFCLEVTEQKIRNAMDRLYLPQPDANGIVPQFDGYAQLQSIDLSKYKNADKLGTIYDDLNPEQINGIQVHKQADTLVLMLLMDNLFPQDLKVRNFYFYESRTLHDSSLSKSTHSVLASDLGEKDMAYRFYNGCGDVDLGPKMNTSDMGVHTASMGGIWQCVVYGFGGVRVVSDELHIAPHLPDAWQELTFPLIWHGQRLMVYITPEHCIAENQGAEAVVVTLCGKPTAIGAGEAVQTDF